MKSYILLLTAISGLASAIPFTNIKIDNPYLVCKKFDINCKIEQSKLCYDEVFDCFKTNYQQFMNCIMLSNLCNEIWLNNNNSNNNNNDKPTSEPQPTQISEPVNTEPQPTQISEPVNTEPQPTQISEPVNTEPQPTQISEPVINNSFEPTKDNVKIIGRAKYMNNSLWVGHTDSGIEFKINGKTVTIVVSTDGIYGSSSEENPAHILVYGDDKLILDTYTTENPKELNVEFDEIGEHIVRLIKISECQYGSIYIDEIKTDSNVITPTSPKDKKIEFIGDSITSAFGSVENLGPCFTSFEDGTKSYAYKVAQKFNVDYSIFSFSSYGIYSGYLGEPIRVTDFLIPPIYEKLGRLNWNFDYPENTTLAMSSVDWDAKEFEPDLIVINLGTNDAFYINSLSDENLRATEQINFTNAYKDFITQVRSVHPNSEILCTIGSMGQFLYQEIENAVHAYVNETNDLKINAFQLNEQDIEKNGEGFFGHPGILSQVDSAYETISKIEELYGWVSDPNVDINEN
ncbi:hypothetical protein BCR32DRAFT_326256 [Anaeromyces robustus]|uniref:Carbohydrate esterase 2 N-terminal domain-containing protein n=1 Tax=Anaeromyces robustus TaxID=1754192 RepID=A0A1Y1XE90_9FUNG|nr:hypothetical protein BCR32DRAFT_326256 [Anaeromyces robustus]|eukprot:ORX83694.1 hypothetical protein BCR32DRAFT_326256 [Anaeromyces robustus]